jgi:hypothetical protein
MEEKNITAAIQANEVSALLEKYKEYRGDDTLTSEDFYSFITTPTTERDVFIAQYCNTEHGINENVLSTYLEIK